MSASPAYAATPANACVTISTANTNRDGSGVISDLITGAVNGSRVDDINIAATGTTTAGMLRMYLNDTVNNNLIKEIPVTANTPSTSNPVWQTALTDLGIVLKPGWKLRFSTNNAESFSITVTRAGDF